MNEHTDEAETLTAKPPLTSTPATIEVLLSCRINSLSAFVFNSVSRGWAVIRGPELEFGLVELKAGLEARRCSMMRQKGPL